MPSFKKLRQEKGKYVLIVENKFQRSIFALAEYIVSTGESH